MDDLLSEFLTETSEALAILDVELVKFEQDPSDSEILGNIFRLVHTIKGTCGFLGLPRLESVAHAGENVLGKFRDGVVDVTPEAVTLILKCLDTIRELLSKLEETGEEPEGEDGALIAELNDLTPLGRFDVVFCRNVLIYFDQETKSRVLDGIADLMPDDGTLFLGGAETVFGISKRFQPVAGQRGIYGLVPAKADA